ncbi:MAG TPA: serine/threonine-protein kinase, partial [Polyangiaceae bacterium]
LEKTLFPLAWDVRKKHTGTVKTVGSAEASSCRPTLAPGANVGGYVVLRRIGEGGLGIVYEARHQRLGKRVAIKTLNESMAADPKVWERFLREGRAAAKLRHPNVVDVSDVAFEADRPYLVMELLEGEELSALIKRESPLSVQRTVDLLIPIVSALAHAHDCGVVHRDLKPQNVFLSRSPAGLVIPKVVDFGISKLLNDEPIELTNSRAFLGSPPYMSPEQAGGAKVVEFRSDQFSLGVIAYECLTGFRPFAGDSLFSLLSAVINDEPPPIHSEGAHIPSELAAVITKMMSKAPYDRFDCMRSVGAGFLPFASPMVQFAYEEEFKGCARQALDLGQRHCDNTGTTDCMSTRPWELGRAGLALSQRPMRTVVVTSAAVIAAIVGTFAYHPGMSGSYDSRTAATEFKPSSSTTSIDAQLADFFNLSTAFEAVRRADPAQGFYNVGGPIATPEVCRSPVISVETTNHAPRSIGQGAQPRRKQSIPMSSSLGNAPLPDEAATAAEAPRAPERGINGALILP